MITLIRTSLLMSCAKGQSSILEISLKSSLCALPGGLDHTVNMRRGLVLLLTDIFNRWKSTLLYRMKLYYFSYCCYYCCLCRVGNFRVEPPNLFRGRGDHPKMGKLKQYILPEDVTVNCAADAPAPRVSNCDKAQWYGIFLSALYLDMHIRM